MKRFLSVVLSVAMLFTMTSMLGCNNSNKRRSDITYLDISANHLGTGGPWIESLADRFEKAHKDVSYADGKTGVIVEINDLVEGRTDISMDGNAIYMNGANGSVATFVASGSYLNINDIVTEDLEVIDGKMVSIEDKIPEEAREYHKVNGDYYAIPTEEDYAIVTYDKHLFDTLGLYLAKSGGVSRYSSVMQKAYSVVGNDKTAVKTCGPDGVSGNSDDGLPSSLYEFAALCDIMYTYYSVEPFALTGAYRDYCNSLLDALMTSLQGPQADAMYSLEGDSYDVITGWTNENLFPGVNDIKKPIVQTIPITEETGYYTTWSADKYYAEAFVELIQKKGWWFAGTDMGTKDHIATQQDFIYSGYGTNQKIGMLVEFSYWYNEASYYQSFDYFYAEYPDVEEREIAIMPLPIDLSKSVTEGNGETYTILRTGVQYLAVNNNIANDAEMLKVVKDFIKFIFTDEQLSYRTIEQRLPVGLNYKINPEHKMETFTKSLWDLSHKANVVDNQYYNYQTFKFNRTLFQRGFNDGCFYLPGYLSCFEVMYNGDATAKSSFEDQMLNKNQWANYYRGALEVGDYQGLIYNS